MSRLSRQGLRGALALVAGALTFSEGSVFAADAEWLFAADTHFRIAPLGSFVSFGPSARGGAILTLPVGFGVDVGFSRSDGWRVSLAASAFGPGINYAGFGAHAAHDPSVLGAGTFGVDVRKTLGSGDHSASLGMSASLMGLVTGEALTDTSQGTSGGLVIYFFLIPGGW